MLQQWNIKHKKKLNYRQSCPNATKQSIQILLNNPADSGDKPVQFVNQLYEDIQYSLCFCYYSWGKIMKPWISKLPGKVPDKLTLRKNYASQLCNTTLNRLTNEGTIQFGYQWMQPMILNNSVSLMPYSALWEWNSQQIICNNAGCTAKCKLFSYCCIL